jgi:preprotein translocase subunit SecG
MGWSQFLLALVLLFTCALLILVILLQRGRGGGLVGAFGGAGGTSAFGAKTGDVFTWITVVVAAVFVLLSIAANYVFDQSPRPPDFPAAVSDGRPPITVEGEGGVPIKVEPVNINTESGTAPPPPVRIDVTQGTPQQPNTTPAGETMPPVQPKPQGAEQPKEEPKKEEAPPAGNEGKPDP